MALRQYFPVPVRDLHVGADGTKRMLIVAQCPDPPPPHAVASIAAENGSALRNTNIGQSMGDDPQTEGDPAAMQ